MERLTGRHGQCLRSTSPVPAEWSVFYKAIRRTRRRNGPLPEGARSIYRYLAECLSAWVRNRVICRYVLPCPVFHPLFATAIPFCLLSSRLSPPRILHNGTPRYVLRQGEKSFPSPHAHAHTRKTHVHSHTAHLLLRMISRISSVFHPARIDITRSVTSTLKPLSAFSLSRSFCEIFRIGNSLTMEREYCYFNISFAFMSCDKYI